jgi:long-chain acyl-CoA synthetase
MATTPASPRKSAVDVFRDRVARSGSRTALRHKVGTEWQAMSWDEWGAASREIAAGLLATGVAPTDRVAIFASTRLEWVLCDVGALQAGAVVVPIYPSSLPDQAQHILADSGAVVAIAEDAQQLAKLAAVKDRLPALRRVVLLSGTDDRDWVTTLGAVREEGRAWLAAHPARLGEIAAAIDPAQTATIIYTSGTTGPPKGVVLTHANLVFEIGAVENLLGLGEEDEQLLFLPLAHSFARVVEWACIAIGASTAFAEGLPQLVPNMGEVRPTFVAAVPRVFEKAYAKMQATFAEKRKKAIARKIVDWSLAQGRERSEKQRRGEPAESWRYRMADRLVFQKVRATFGGRLRFFVSGGAPLSAEIAEFFHAAGILVLEGYGLTETTAAATCNRPDSYRFGTVGPALPGVEIKIAADGEILIRGGNIMTGYWNAPAATAEVLDADGWFHSGDIGVIEEGGHVRITDRKKDIIVTAGGKNVAPQNIENDLKASCPLVSQAVVLGDRQKFLVALLTLTEEAARDRAAAESVVADAVATLNKRLASYETIKRHKILDQDFTEESGELTPSLKVKRKVVSERHRAEIEKLYSGGERE